MALGLLFRVSWICFLLFSGCAALPAIKGYGSPYGADSHNLGDDLEDEVLNAATSDQTDWVGSYSQATGPSVPELTRPVNGDPKDWGLDHLDKTITHYAGPTVYSQPKPLLLSQATNSGSKFPSFEPEPVSSHHFKGADFGFGSPNQNIDSSVKGGYSTDSPHLIYEEVFLYPAAENTEGGLPYLGYGDDSHYMEEYDIVHEPSEESRVTEPIFPQPTYIVQSSSGYGQHRVLVSETRYEPELSPPANVGSKGVKRPAPSRLISIPGAGSKGARNPQRSKW